MRRVRREHSTPELIVRQELHRRGFRYRLHVKKLPGSPDLVFPSKKIAVFVHGCFWHQHAGCRAATMPKTRRSFWLDKFEHNIERDAKNIAQLQAAGWRVHVVWECETKTGSYLDPLLRFLIKPGQNFVSDREEANPLGPA